MMANTMPPRIETSKLVCLDGKATPTKTNEQTCIDKSIGSRNIQ
jgi:hypothetical protein